MLCCHILFKVVQALHTPTHKTGTQTDTDRQTAKKETLVFIIFYMSLVKKKKPFRKWMRRFQVASYMLENHVEAIGCKWLLNIQRTPFWNCKVAKCIILSCISSWKIFFTCYPFYLHYMFCKSSRVLFSARHPFKSCYF